MSGLNIDYTIDSDGLPYWPDEGQSQFTIDLGNDEEIDPPADAPEDAAYYYVQEDGSLGYMTEAEYALAQVYEQYGDEGVRAVVEDLASVAATDHAEALDAIETEQEQIDALIQHLGEDEAETAEAEWYAEQADQEAQRQSYTDERNDLQTTMDATDAVMGTRNGVRLGPDFDAFVYKADGDFQQALLDYKDSGQAKRPTLDDATADLASVTSRYQSHGRDPLNTGIGDAIDDFFGGR
jgi:hypothetical protein